MILFDPTDSAAVYARGVRDLRKLRKQERDALKLRAACLAKAGQEPEEICQALGLRHRTFAAWTKRGEFDASTQSKTRKPDQPEGPAPEGTDHSTTAQAVLARVRNAIRNGDRKGADRIVASWASERRRQKALLTLEAEAARERQLLEAEGALSDARLAAEVSDLIGRQVWPICPGSEKS